MTVTTATLATTLGQTHPTIHRPAGRHALVAFPISGSLAALGLLLALLIVMAPGLARIPATSATPVSLQAPPPRIEAAPVAEPFPNPTVTLIVDPTPQPGPAIAR